MVVRRNPKGTGGAIGGSEGSSGQGAGLRLDPASPTFRWHTSAFAAHALRKLAAAGRSCGSSKDPRAGDQDEARSSKLVLCADDRPPASGTSLPRKPRRYAACRRPATAYSNARAGSERQRRRDPRGHRASRGACRKPQGGRYSTFRPAGKVQAPAGRPAVSPIRRARCSLARIQGRHSESKSPRFAATVSRSVRRQHSAALAIQRRPHASRHFLRRITPRAARSPIAYGGVRAVTSCDQSVGHSVPSRHRRRAERPRRR